MGIWEKLGRALGQKSEQELLREAIDTEIKKLELELKQVRGQREGFKSSGDNRYNARFDEREREILDKIGNIKQRGEEQIAKLRGEITELEKPKLEIAARGPARSALEREQSERLKLERVK